MTKARLCGLAVLGALLCIAPAAGAEELYYDFGSGYDSIGTGWDSWGSYSYDTSTGYTLTDTTTYTAPNAASSWDYASTVPEGGYTIINGVMWPTCYGCTAGMTGSQATSLGVYDAYRQYNSWSLFVNGYGWTDSVYMGSYQGDTSFFISNNYAFTHDLAVEQLGQSMFNLFTPYCASLCVATVSNGQLTDAVTGNYLSNWWGRVYDSFGNPAGGPISFNGGGGDGDGDGDGG